ncbi:MAG: Holliday junction resolvase RuvX [Gammaproteobacteria bacterium]|nr:Holliday junction resolvase RuvX [Gammaproteobacteria bacterium]
MRDGHVLAFDFGLRHIGVAVGQAVTCTASPLITLKAANGTPSWSDVGALVKEWAPTTLVVGLPLNMDDSESEMSALARAFADKLVRRFALPVEMVDERLTTVAASQTDARRVHEVAAALIAQTWLGADSPPG